MTALVNIHFTRFAGGLQFTLKGLLELTMRQRQQIEIAFYAGGLGDTYEFPEYMELHEYEPESVEEEPTESDNYDPRQDEVLADKLYEDGKDRRWQGLVYTREIK